MTIELKTNFESKLTSLLNKQCMENDSNTPDFILSQYLLNCLDSFNIAVKRRDKWYGIKLEPGYLAMERKDNAKT